MRQISYPQLAFAVLCGCLLLGLFWGLSTSGVAYGPYNYDWDGGSDLRSTVDADAEMRLALSTDDYERTPPTQTAAFVLEPRDGYDGSERAQLSSFVSQGGTLVVASAANESSGLLSDLGSTVRIDGATLRDEQHNMQEGAFPRATDVSTHELVRDVDALTLNHGSALNEGEATPIVNSTTVSYLDRNESGELDDDETLASRPVATVESVGAGEIVVLSDASLFTNGMLEADGNSQFVRNVAADHEYVLLDYSQQGSLPAATYVWLLIRDSPLLQFVVGLAGVGAIIFWRQGRLAVLWNRWLSDTQTAPDATESMSADTLSSYLSQRHPTWDERRVQRVTEAIIRERQQEASNE